MTLVEFLASDANNPDIAQRTLLNELMVYGIRDNYQDKLNRLGQQWNIIVSQQQLIQAR